MVKQVDKSKEIPGTTIFGGSESRKGYRLNKFAMSFTTPSNREAFSAEAEARREAEIDLALGIFEEALAEVTAELLASDEGGGGGGS